MSGFELLETVKSDPRDARDPDHHLHRQGAVSQPEETRLRKFAETIIVKDVKSPERLLDETALFLHRVEAKLPEQKRRMLERLHNADAVFAGKQVLDRRRRRAQHLLAHERARGPRHERRRSPRTGATRIEHARSDARTSTSC